MSVLITFIKLIAAVFDLLVIAVYLAATFFLLPC